jgi:hypothetical protein
MVSFLSFAAVDAQPLYVAPSHLVGMISRDRQYLLNEDGDDDDDDADDDDDDDRQYLSPGHAVCLPEREPRGDVGQPRDLLPVRHHHLDAIPVRTVDALPTPKMILSDQC